MYEYSESQIQVKSIRKTGTQMKRFRNSNEHKPRKENFKTACQKFKTVILGIRHILEYVLCQPYSEPQRHFSDL